MDKNYDVFFDCLMSIWHAMTAYYGVADPDDRSDMLVAILSHAKA